MPGNKANIVVWSFQAFSSCWKWPNKFWRPSQRVWFGASTHSVSNEESAGVEKSITNIYKRQMRNDIKYLIKSRPSASGFTAQSNMYCVECVYELFILWHVKSPRRRRLRFRWWISREVERIWLCGRGGVGRCNEFLQHSMASKQVLGNKITEFWWTVSTSSTKWLTSIDVIILYARLRNHSRAYRAHAAAPPR